jgi:hypothetical protein
MQQSYFWLEGFYCCGEFSSVLDQPRTILEISHFSKCSLLKYRVIALDKDFFIFLGWQERDVSNWKISSKTLQKLSRQAIELSGNIAIEIPQFYYKLQLKFFFRISTLSQQTFPAQKCPFSWFWLDSFHHSAQTSVGVLASTGNLSLLAMKNSTTTSC